jgi:hypothetical protein
MDIYWEKQRGGLCRLHSINAYFGRAEFDEKQFNEEASKFDIIQTEKFGENISCQNFDIVNSDQRNLVTHILASRGIYVRYVPLNTHPDGIQAGIYAGCFFVFNLDHIWFVKKYECGWRRVDSMSGVNVIDPASLVNEKNIGLMIPVRDNLAEFCRTGRILAELVRPDVDQFIKDMNSSAKILGEAEQCLGSMVEILRVQHRSRDGPPLIKQFIFKYDKFIKKMNKGDNRNNLTFILKDAGSVIRTLIKIVKISAF